MEIPIVSGLDLIRNPEINNGEENFIQIYFNNLPYFRIGPEEHYNLLEKFLQEVNIAITDFEKDSLIAPARKGKLYELVDAGIISEATLIKKNMDELSGGGYIAIKGYSKKYNLYPNIRHISRILKYFEEPLIFASSEYLTEEKREIIENPQWEDLGGEDGEPLE